MALVSTHPPVLSDGLTRATPAQKGVDARAVAGFIADVEQAGLELHNLMLWRDGAVVAEGWRWPYQAGRTHISHSMTKSITACAIGLLIDDGRLSLQDRIGRFFPELAIDPETPAGRITVEHLLTMRTGHDAEVSGSIWRGIPTSWVAEFFKIPIVHEPGTFYKYSSAASYMLSAVFTRVTGETMDQYLRLRLFVPMGLQDLRWAVGPDGVNPGGNGIDFTTADGLKFGILHAQGGMWEGKRLLPQSWVEQATRAQGAPDYGYHWVIGDTYYAMLGQFVQMVVVYPEANAVLALNGAMEESAVLLPHLKRHFPAAFAGPASAEDDRALAERLVGWATPSPFNSQAAGDQALFGGGRWTATANGAGITAIDFAFPDGELELILHDAAGAHRVRAPHDDWREAPTALPGASLHHGYALAGTPTVAGWRWLADNRIELVLHFVETAFRDTITATVTDGRLELDRRVNINSGDRAWPTITATR